jgi:pimeloyl-ACP methyl ester carboxylesterase
MFVPGGVMPADLSYGPLLQALGDGVRPIVKDLEVYATDAPPADYSLHLEADGIGRAADAAGAQRFHLVGYSGGGASSLAFIAQQPERVASLALIEPAWIGTVAAEDAAKWAEIRHIMTLPDQERMSAFARWQMRPRVEPPKLPVREGPPPPWMAKRPAGLSAFLSAFDTYKLDQSRFRLFKAPVYFALGSLSTRFYEHEAQVLAGLFPDFQVEEYEGRSHFNPPHRAEPERFANALRALWKQAQTA